MNAIHFTEAPSDFLKEVEASAKEMAAYYRQKGDYEHVDIFNEIVNQIQEELITRTAMNYQNN